MARLLTASCLLFACSSGGAPDHDRAPASNDAKTVEPAQKVQQPEVAATPEPPAAPEGAVLLRKPNLYVQRCAAEDACPQLMQEAGAARCGELKLGTLSWRLPERDEAKRFWGAKGLENLETFHWTRTPYEEDAQQVWISDPKTRQETTLPKTRRPFVVRCVADVPR